MINYPVYYLFNRFASFKSYLTAVEKECLCVLWNFIFNLLQCTNVYSNVIGVDVLG